MFMWEYSWQTLTGPSLVLSIPWPGCGYYSIQKRWSQCETQQCMLYKNIVSRDDWQLTGTSLPLPFPFPLPLFADSEGFFSPWARRLELDERASSESFWAPKAPRRKRGNVKQRAELSFILVWMYVSCRESWYRVQIRLWFMSSMVQVLIRLCCLDVWMLVERQSIP